jgi:hypothetical protein
MSSKVVNAAGSFFAIVSVPLLTGASDFATIQQHSGRYHPNANSREWNAHNLRPSAYASQVSPVHARSPISGAQGQYPAPPEVAARSALPLCGFAAIQSWGPNGFQYCDSHNVHAAPSHSRLPW